MIDPELHRRCEEILSSAFYDTAGSLTMSRPPASIVKQIDEFIDLLDSYQRRFSVQKTSYLIVTGQWSEFALQSVRNFEKWPNDYEVCFDRAKCFFLQGRWLNARMLYEKALTIKNSDDIEIPSLYEDLSLCCCALGDYKNAKHYCDTAITRYPEQSAFDDIKKIIAGKNFRAPDPILTCEGKEVRWVDLDTSG